MAGQVQPSAPLFLLSAQQIEENAADNVVGCGRANHGPDHLSLAEPAHGQ